MTIVLRVSSLTLDVEEATARLPPELVIKTWARGDLDRLRRQQERSGFNLLLSDDHDLRQGLDEAARELERVNLEISRLASEGVDLKMDIALYVRAAAASRVHLPHALLVRLVQLGVSVIVSAYPCSDDEDDDD